MISLSTVGSDTVQDREIRELNILYPTDEQFFVASDTKCYDKVICLIGHFCINGKELKTRPEE